MSAILRPNSGRLPNELLSFIRQVHTRRRQKPSSGFQGPEGHGEKIWVHSHRRSHQIIYSFNETLDAFHALKQLPFNGKKTKPAKLRKDYWSPMAVVQFPRGHGEVGRSVYQKLRELKHLHEVAWTDELRYKRPEEYTDADEKKVAQKSDKGKVYRPVRSKAERGAALNAQKKNAIADMAVVLSGQGAGNKMGAAPAPAPAAAAAAAAAAAVAEGEEALRESASGLLQVSVLWANDQDREYAESWSENVTHELFRERADDSKLGAESIA